MAGPPPITKPVYRDASVVTSRPVTPGPIFKPNPPEALTSGSQLDVTAYGGAVNNEVSRGKYGNPVFSAGSQLNTARYGAPWPAGIDAGAKAWTAYVPNTYRQVAVVKVMGNYGNNTSRSNFGFREQEYPADSVWGGQAGYPGPVPSAVRPMWNNLLSIIWQLRVRNPVAGGSLNNTTQAASQQSVNAHPATYTPSGTASLIFKGESLA